MSATYAEGLAPELQLALRQAVRAADPEEHAASLTREAQARVVGVLTGIAASVALYDALLLLAS
jgi:hypothetical protein